MFTEDPDLAFLEYESAEVDGMPGEGTIVVEKYARKRGDGKVRCGNCGGTFGVGEGDGEDEMLLDSF